MPLKKSAPRRRFISPAWLARATRSHSLLDSQPDKAGKDHDRDEDTAAGDFG
jgi:hypothetical protein